MSTVSAVEEWYLTIYMFPLALVILSAHFLRL